MQEIFLHTGSNLGNRHENLEKSVALINQLIGTVVCKSSYYETSAWGNTDQPDFINQALCLHSSLAPMKLLKCIWSIEEELGRQRISKWGARTIDIDILFYGSEIIRMPDLTIPHQLLHERRFVLTPLNEIAPDLIHPILNKTVTELLSQLTDDLSVKKLNKKYY